MSGTPRQRAAMTKLLMQHPKIKCIRTKNYSIYLEHGGKTKKIAEDAVKFYAWASALHNLQEQCLINIETGEVWL